MFFFQSAYEDFFLKLIVINKQRSADHQILDYFYCGGNFLCYLRIPFSKNSVIYQDVALTVFLYFIKKA